MNMDDARPLKVAREPISVFAGRGDGIVSDQLTSESTPSTNKAFGQGDGGVRWVKMEDFRALSETMRLCWGAGGFGNVRATGKPGKRSAGAWGCGCFAQRREEGFLGSASNGMAGNQAFSRTQARGNFTIPSSNYLLCIKTSVVQAGVGFSSLSIGDAMRTEPARSSRVVIDRRSCVEMKHSKPFLASEILC